MIKREELKEKIFAGNKIKRCFLNNVLQRFDKKDKGTTGTDFFHKQWGKFVSFGVESLVRRTPLQMEMLTNTIATAKVTTNTAIDRTHSDPVRAFTNTGRRRRLKAFLETSLAMVTDYSRLLPLHLRCSLFAALCVSANAIRSFRNFSWETKPQECHLTSWDNFSITFAGAGVEELYWNLDNGLCMEMEE